MMEIRNRRRRWATLAVVLVAAAGVVVWLLAGRPSSDGTTPTSSTNTASQQPAETTPHKRHMPTQDDGSPAHPTFSTVKMPKVMQRVLDANPDLAEYYGLEQKVMPTAEERKKLHALLADPDMIQQINDYLLAEETSFTKDGEAKRMVAVEFLGDAVSWPDNPARPQVMEAIQNVMFADNIAADAPDELAQSLAADKMELYTQLLGRSPDGASAIAEAAKGKPIEGLLAYTQDTYNREVTTRLADEAQHH